MKRFALSWTVTSFAAALAFPPAVWAQTAPESVVVTGTHLSNAISASNSNVSVIDADEIAARQPVSIADLLSDLPGVYVQQSGGRGSVVSLFTRGAKPNFTLVLVDGVKVNDPTNTRGGSYDFSSMDLNGIERVEFVRGPSSAIYGSDAVGGVLNIITRKGSQESAASLTVEGGSYGLVRVGGRIEGPIGGASGTLGVVYNDNGMPTPGNSLHGVSVDGGLSLPSLAGFDISFNGRYEASAATAFPDSSGGPRLAVLRTLDHRNIDEGILGAHAVRQMSDIWSMNIDYGLYDRAARAVSPGVAPSAQTPFGIPASTDDVHFLRNQVTWTNQLAFSPALEAALGMDLQLENGTDDGTLKFGPTPIPTRFTKDRTSWAAFAEGRYRPMENLALSASVRFDQASDGTGHVSPQVRAEYTLAATGTELEASRSQGYKLPSFYALGNPIVGDPTLKPETAASYDVGLSQPLGDFGRWKLGAYDTHYSDLIDFQPGAVPKLVNLSKVRSRGVETSLDAVWREFTVSPHVSYTDTRNTMTGAALRDVPAWLAGTTVQWRLNPQLTGSFDLSQVGPLIDNSVPTGDVKLGGYTRANLALSYQYQPGMKFFAAVDNLFDARDEAVVGFPQPGLVVRGGLSASL